MKYWAYIALLTFLAITGHIIAKAVEYHTIPQYTCNFVYAVIITLFFMENWTLVMDINYYNRHHRERESHIAIIKELTETNNRLVQRNIILKEEITRIHRTEKSMGEDAIKCIIHWRNQQFFKRDSLGSPDLSSSSENINDSKNIEIKSPFIQKLQRSLSKIPPIDQEDSL